MFLLAALVQLGGCKALAKRLTGQADNGELKAAVAGALGTAAESSSSAKLSTYIECTNRVDSNMRGHMRSYRQWVKTNNFRSDYPSLNTYSDYDKERCVTKVLAAVGNSTEALDVAAKEYAAAVDELMPKINDAEKYYYKTHEYQDDHYAKGKAWNAGILQSFERFEKASLSFNELVDKANLEHLAQALAEVEKNEGKKFRWHEMTLMASARKLADTVDEQVIAPEAYATALSKFLADNEALDAWVNANPKEKDRGHWSWFESAKDDFVKEARDLGRAVKATKGKTGEREDFIKEYNDLVEKDNDLK